MVCVCVLSVRKVCVCVLSVRVYVCAECAYGVCVCVFVFVFVFVCLVRSSHVCNAFFCATHTF